MTGKDRVKIKGSRKSKTVHLEVSSVNPPPPPPRLLGPDTLIHGGKYYSPSESTSLWGAIDAYKHWLKDCNIEDLQQYVVVFAHANYVGECPRHVILVKKPEETMHAGLINLPGGRVRTNETPETAAIRKFAEETGVPANLITFPAVIGAILPSTWDWDSHAPPEDLQPPFIVYVVQATIQGSANISSGNSHQPRWTVIGEVNDPRYVPGLALLLPLCTSGVKGFIIQDGWSTEGTFSNIYTGQTKEVVTFFREYQRPTRRKERITSS